ncbi:hypothetical protein [Streptomyces sp. NPDC013187]|uniref:hypothetical protein n=1 Tax=Streptomyces sp. NPDC013187 TaxID=3364865 RepID=UPI0036C993F5
MIANSAIAARMTLSKDPDPDHRPRRIRRITVELETLFGRPAKTVRWALENQPRIRELAAA